MAENPPRKTALASLLVSLFAGVLFFAPGFLGIDGFDGGFAISFVSLLAAVIGIIVALYYFSLASKLDRILRGEGVLARWTYSPEFWREYTEREYAEEKTEKKGLFIMVSVIALIVGFVFVLVDSEAGLFVFAVMLGLIGLVAFVWQFSSWHDYRQNVHGVREAIIARNAVYLNKKFIAWRTVLTSFDGVTLRNSRSMPMLMFTYTVTNVRYGPQSYTTRVPIPPGEEEAAKEIVRQINQQN
jgi:hypothetical protein